MVLRFNAARHLPQSDKVLIPFVKNRLTKNSINCYFCKNKVMKTDKNKDTEANKAKKPRLQTDKPLAEKDEVKQAEANQRKKSEK